MSCTSPLQGVKPDIREGARATPVRLPRWPQVEIIASVRMTVTPETKKGLEGFLKVVIDSPNNEMIPEEFHAKGMGHLRELKRLVKAVVTGCGFDADSVDREF